MPSVSLYRIADADLTDASIRTILWMDDSPPAEVPLKREISGRLFIFRDPPDTPEWAQYIAPIATRELRIPAREGIGAVLLLKPDARNRIVYAATWGSGRFQLRSDRLSPDGGLRCALNLISGEKTGERSWDPARVRALRSKRVSQNTLIIEMQSSRKTTIDSFLFSADVDQLRRVTGTPTDIKRFGRTVSGGVSIHVKRPEAPHELLPLCRHIERVHNSTDYQRHFGWIDNVSPITAPKLIEKANDQIVRGLRVGRLDNFSLTPPSLVSWEDITTFEYQWGRQSSTIEEPSIESFHAFLIKHDLMSELSAETLRDSARLHALDSNGGKMQSWSIARCLSGELTFGHQTYILDDGTLLFVATDYLRELNRFTKEIAEPVQLFPRTFPAEKEGAYNKRLSRTLSGAILLDQRVVRRPQATDVEICDVALRTKHLIHVKRGSSSSSLSHLFAQGVVSAELLHMDAAFRKEVKKKFSNKLMGTGAGLMKDFAWLHVKQFEPHVCEVVFAIMTERPREMSREELPFFSKVNLRMRCHELRRMGFKYSLALVPTQ
jgi:uncharacterized protein (TIGR04141 family)